MNEPFDPLEAELGTMWPRKMTPELQRRVAARLTETAIANRWPSRRSALMAGLVAACLAALIVLKWPAPSGNREQNIVPPRPVEVVAARAEAPTLQIYQLTLARSPEELNTLLDNQSETTSAANFEPVHVCTFMWSEAALHAFLGDD